MTQQDNGGAAFPQMVGGGEFGIRPVAGMSLRDWFAGQAIIGLVQRPEKADTKSFGDAADAAYWIADALLAARSAK